MLTKFHVYISGVLFFKVLIGKTPSHGSTNDDGVDLRHHVRSIVHEKWNTQLFDIQLLRHHKFEEEMVWLLQGVIYCVVQYLNRWPHIRGWNTCTISESKCYFYCCSYIISVLLWRLCSIFYCYSTISSILFLFCIFYISGIMQVVRSRRACSVESTNSQFCESEVFLGEMRKFPEAQSREALGEWA